MQGRSLPDHRTSSPCNAGRGGGGGQGDGTGVAWDHDLEFLLYKHRRHLRVISKNFVKRNPYILFSRRGVRSRIFNERNPYFLFLRQRMIFRPRVLYTYGVYDLMKDARRS